MFLRSTWYALSSEPAASNLKPSCVWYKVHGALCWGFVAVKVRDASAEASVPTPTVPIPTLFLPSLTFTLSTHLLCPHSSSVHSLTLFTLFFCPHSSLCPHFCRPRPYRVPGECFNREATGRRGGPKNPLQRKRGGRCRHPAGVYTTKERKGCKGCAWRRGGGGRRVGGGGANGEGERGGERGSEERR